MKSEYKDVSEPVQELALLVFNHFGKKPMGWTGIDKLTEYAHNEQFAKKVFCLHDFLTNNESVFDGINPSQYYKIIYKFQLATKSLDYDVHQIVQCYFDLANYAIRSYNKQYSSISKEARECNYIPITTESGQKKVGFLCALLRSFSESVYCDEHTISGEIVSPIVVDDGFVIARRYRNINACELCSDLIDTPYKSIYVFVKYTKGISLPQTDIVGNLLLDNNCLSCMQGVHVNYIDKDGNEIVCKSINEFGDIIRFFSRLIPIIICNFRKLSMRDRLWRKVESEYYALKPFCDICGIDWRPTPYDLDFETLGSTGRPIVYANNLIASLSDDDEIKQKLFDLNDPRKHWKHIQEAFI